MQPIEHLWWHQARLLASGLTRHFKQAKKKKTVSAMRHEIDRATNTCNLLIWHLKTGAPK